MKIKQPGAHFDHMMRQTRMHHVQLSSMADMKANMLLTMSSVVLTLSLRYVLDPTLKWASITMMFFCLLTILLAAYSTMPKIRTKAKENDVPDPHSPSFNPLFFGDFTRLSYQEFESSMEEILNDPNLAYQVQIREVYGLGMFLARKKYRFIRWAYLCFITGLLSSGLVLLLTGVII